MCSWQKANIIFDRIINLMAVLAGILMMLTLFLVCGDIGTKLTIGRSLPWVAEIVEYSLTLAHLFGHRMGAKAKRTYKNGHGRR